LNHTSNPFFSSYFGDGALMNYLPGLASNLDPLNLSLAIKARITGMHYWSLAQEPYLNHPLSSFHALHRTQWSQYLLHWVCWNSYSSIFPPNSALPLLDLDPAPHPADHLGSSEMTVLTSKGKGQRNTKDAKASLRPNSRW
jgi:hypothetical protein